MAGLRPFLRPASVAVVGDSPGRGSTAGTTLDALRAGGCTGTLHAVAPYDVSGDDLLQWREMDQRTTPALLDLEPLGRLRALSRITRRMARSMPVLTVDTGRGVASCNAKPADPAPMTRQAPFPCTPASVWHRAVRTIPAWPTVPRGEVVEVTKEQKTLWDYGAHAPGHALSGHILVGVDGSPQATRALDHAAAEARTRLAPLEILHAWPWARHGAADVPPGAKDMDSLIDGAQAVLEHAAARVRERAPEIDVVQTLSPESAAIELVRRGECAALTVVGSRGPGRVTELLGGSVCLRVAACCGSPLLVVRGERTPGAPEHGTVLVGVADDIDASAALFAFEEAQRRGAQVWVLHVATAPRPSSGLRTPATARPTADLRTRLRGEDAVPRMAVSALREKFPDVGVRIDTVWSGAAGALVEASRAADLVVITARHRHGRRLGHQVGPFTHALLHGAHCPVVLAPVG